MKKEDMHQKVLENLYQKYWDEGFDNNLEFIWDGPSHWEKYENSSPRIVFLAKESHGSYHPSTPSKVNNLFSTNIATWASLLNPNYDELQKAWDSIAIVEIKKIDEGKTSSTNSDIKKFAWIGKEFLKQQLEILEPHIIVCLGTIDSFDIIYNYSEEEKELYEKKIYSNKKCNCWISNNVIVLDFYHASHRKKKDDVLNLMKELISNELVHSEYLKLLNLKNI